jgi:hypothetical protein
MRGKRERLFDCSYGPPGDESHIVFRAWNPVEAAHGTEEALQRAGIPYTGQITVRDPRGRVLLRVSALPRPDAGISGAA